MCVNKKTIQLVFSDSKRFSGSLLKDPQFLLNQDFFDSKKTYTLESQVIIKTVTAPTQPCVLLYSNDLITSPVSTKTLLNVATQQDSSGTTRLLSDKNKLSVEALKNKFLSFQFKFLDDTDFTDNCNYKIILQFTEN